VPLHEIYARWIANSNAAASARCATSRESWKGMTMKKPDYVYVTYIATTPEKAWRALIDTDVTRQYWVDPSAGCARVNVSDWQPGSRWEHRAPTAQARSTSSARSSRARPRGASSSPGRGPPTPTTIRSIRASRSTSSPMATSSSA
jgi:hypothetical protein